MKDDCVTKEYALKYLERSDVLNRISAVYVWSTLKEKKRINKEILDQALQNHKTNKAKPFVKWVGGKRQLLRQFKETDLI